MTKRLLVAVVVLAALPTVAHAQGSSFEVIGGPNLISSTFVEGRLTGSLVVSFQGSPGGGCSAGQACAYSGVIVWRPGPAGTYTSLDIDKLRQHHRVVTRAGLDISDDLGTPSLTTSVRRQSGVTTIGTCADAKSLGSTTTLPVHQGSLSFRLLGAGTSVLGTRCAGPLDADVARAVVSRSLSVRAAARGRRVVDFSGARNFAGGGFTGTVRSTLVLRLQSAETSTPSSGGSPQPGTRRTRMVSMALTMEQLGGDLVASVSGSTNQDVCSTLDSCGARGTLMLELHPPVVHGSIFALGPARRPYRDFLAALGLSRAGRRSGIETFGTIGWGGGGDFGWHMTSPSFCSDSARLVGGDIRLIPAGNRLSVGYSSFGSFFTRCPGPDVAAVTDGLASTTIPLRTLSRHRFTVRLRGLARFTDDGYFGRIGGSLSVTIRRGRVTQTTFPADGISFGLPARDAASR